MTDTSDLPYVANYPALDEWLREHDARCMWQTTQAGEAVTTHATMVEMWQFPNGAQAIVLVRPCKMGWDIFTPGQSHLTAPTLRDAEARLGLETNGKDKTRK